MHLSLRGSKYLLQRVEDSLGLVILRALPSCGKRSPDVAGGLDKSFLLLFHIPTRRWAVLGSVQGAASVPVHPLRAGLWAHVEKGPLCLVVGRGQPPA